MRTIIGRILFAISLVATVAALFAMFITAGDTSNPEWWRPLFTSMGIFVICGLCDALTFRFVDVLATAFAFRNMFRLIDRKVFHSKSLKTEMVYRVWESNDYSLVEAFFELSSMYVDAENESYRELKERRRERSR